MIDFIICIGNGTETADQMAKNIANDYKIIHRGFLDSNTELLSGCYHTSIFDIKPLQLATMVAGIIDRLKIIVLNQPQSEFNSSRDYYDTIDMAYTFNFKCPVEFVNPSMVNHLLQDLKDNKSFCIMPFIALLRGTKHCCYMKSFKDPYTNFKTDSNSIEMRQKMLRGEKTDLCQRCYNYEEVGAVSPRQAFTQDWIYRLNLKSYDDVIKNTKLVKYEIWLGNYCNLQCRMCRPENSNLIDDEYVRIGLSDTKLGIMTENLLDTIDLDTVQQLQVNGGEPSINQDFFNFLKHCIKVGKTDFEIFINTNAVSLTKEFITLIKQFKNIRIAISIDGFDQVNQYIRWPNNWSKFTQNIESLIKLIPPQNYHFHTTVSIYNISKLYEMYDFLNSHYPTATFNMDTLEEPKNLKLHNFANKKIALENLNRIKTLDKYNNDVAFNKRINGIIQILESSQVDLSELADFFKFNDSLDLSRNVKLADYIPELEQCRSYLKDNHA
jgi:uncharacterized Fe-S cluster-containing radical SAM superfamily protein